METLAPRSAEMKASPEVELEREFLRGKEALGVDAGLATSLWRAIRWQALDLCRRGVGPQDPVASPRRFIEGELVRGQSDAGTLRPLLTRFEDLARKAGWLEVLDDSAYRHVPEQGTHGFRESALPTRLVGVAIAREVVRAEVLRKQAVGHRGWGEAAAVAVSLGDDPIAWLALYREGLDPLTQIDRALVALCALGRTYHVLTVAPEELWDIFTIGVCLLIWLAPPSPVHDGERLSPLLLKPDEWRQTALALARLSYRQGIVGGLLVPWQAPPPPVGPLINALALPCQLKEDGIKRALCFCAAREAAQAGLLDGFRYPHDAPHLNLLSAEWFLEIGVPSLYEALPDRAPLLLAVFDEAHPAHQLLGWEAGETIWLAAFEHLLAQGQRAEAMRAFAGLLQRPIYLTLRPLPRAKKLLLEHSLWDEALPLLHERIKDGVWLKHFVHNARQIMDLFHLADVTPDQFGQWLAPPDKQLFVPSVLLALRDAGVPAQQVLPRFVHSVPAGTRQLDPKTLASFLQLCNESGADAMRIIAAAQHGSPRSWLVTVPAGPWCESPPEPAPIDPPLLALLRYLGTYAQDLAVRRACVRRLLAS